MGISFRLGIDESCDTVLGESSLSSSLNPWWGLLDPRPALASTSLRPLNTSSRMVNAAVSGPSNALGTISQERVKMTINSGFRIPISDRVDCRLTTSPQAPRRPSPPSPTHRRPLTPHHSPLRSNKRFVEDNWSTPHQLSSTNRRSTAQWRVCERMNAATRELLAYAY